MCFCTCGLFFMCNNKFLNHWLGSPVDISDAVFSLPTWWKVSHGHVVICLFACVCLMELACEGVGWHRRHHIVCIYFWTERGGVVERRKDCTRTARTASEKVKGRRTGSGDGQRQMGKNEAEGERGRWGSQKKYDVTAGDTDGEKRWDSREVKRQAVMCWPCTEPAVWCLILTPTHDPTVFCYFSGYYTSPNPVADKWKHICLCYAVILFLWIKVIHV